MSPRFFSFPPRVDVDVTPKTLRLFRSKRIKILREKRDACFTGRDQGVKMGWRTFGSHTFFEKVKYTGEDLSKKGVPEAPPALSVVVDALVFAKSTTEKPLRQPNTHILRP